MAWKVAELFIIKKLLEVMASDATKVEVSVVATRVKALPTTELEASYFVKFEALLPPKSSSCSGCHL